MGLRDILGSRPPAEATTRTEIIAAHRTATRESDGRAAEVQAQVDRSTAEIDHLRGSLDEVYGRRRRFEAELASIRHAQDVSRQAFERAMREREPTELRDFLRELDTRAEGLQHQIRRTEGRARDPKTGAVWTTHGDNLEAVRAVAHAIYRAREAAQALIFEDTADIAAAIERLRRSIPTVDEVEDRLRAGTEASA